MKLDRPSNEKNETPDNSGVNKDKLLALLGLANRAGKLALGFSAVEKMVRKGQSPLLVVATDIGASQYGKVERLEPVSEKLMDVLTGSEMAEALGRQKLVLVAVSDSGFVKGIKKLKS